MSKQVEAKLRAIQKRAETATQDLADEWRRSTLIPFCRRHRLTFASAVGRFSFYRDHDPVDRYQVRAIAQMDEALDLDSHTGAPFGVYVRDVTQVDLGRRR